MAAKKWMVLPGGRIKRWRRARTDVRQLVPPHWYRNRQHERRSASKCSRLRSTPYFRSSGMRSGAMPCGRAVSQVAPVTFP